jgi:hypothetical protein
METRKKSDRKRTKTRKRSSLNQMETRKRSSLNQMETRKRGKGNPRKTLKGGIFTSKSRTELLMFILSFWEKLFNTFPSYNDIKLYWNKKNGPLPNETELKTIEAKIKKNENNDSYIEENSPNLSKWKYSDGVFDAKVEAKMPHQPTKNSLPMSNDSKEGSPNSDGLYDVPLN